MGRCPLAVFKMHLHEYEIGCKEFKSGGLNEKHAEGTWSLGSHLSFRFWTQESKENLCQLACRRTFPDTDYLASNPVTEVCKTEIHTCKSIHVN